MPTANSFQRTNSIAKTTRNQGLAAATVAARAGRAGGVFAGMETLEPRQLMVADPVSIAHPTWFANYGAVVVDGVVNDAEWAGSTPIFRAQANRTDSAVTARVKYTELGLYAAFEVSDQYLWADGGGGGSGTRYDWFNDDSIALFFDPSNTRKRLLTPAGRALGFNIAPVNGPETGSGAVTRYNYIRGNNPTGRDGDYDGVQMNPYGALTPGMTWKTVLHGTLNNNSDLDQGWTTEVFLPWETIGMDRAPINGQAITMTFSVLFDDTGGAHDSATHDADTSATTRFGARTLDDQINGTESSFNVAIPGIEGPINYAWLVFSDARTNDKPNPVINLSAANVDGYGARLNFLSPAASSAVLVLGPAKRGGTAAYDIRWSHMPITNELEWDSATIVSNTYVPHPRGQAESLRINGLEPGQTYYMAVRAADGAGRLSDIRQVIFATQTDVQDTSNGQWLLPSPNGGSLVTEAGDPFVMVGSAIIPSNYYVRNLYNGNIWNAGAGRMTNFTVNPGSEGPAAGFFDSLAASGVNTLRVTLEWLALPTAGQGSLPDGNYWIEYPKGNYNPAMKDYLQSVMAEAARTGIRLILKPFDTFNYKGLFNLTPYSTANGGPLTTIDDFFQNPVVKDMTIDRMKTIIDWVHESPAATSVIGIQLPNEWDNWQWTLNARGDGDPSRMQEMRDRSKFILRTAAAVKQYDPSMNIISSTDGVVPHGAVARALFLGDNIDILTPHWYTTTTAEPVNSPDANKSIRPVTDYAAVAGYWQSNKRDNRVINNGEWGLVKWQWDTGRVYYTGVSANPNAAKPWTVQNDVDLYRTTSWTQIALGLGGSGIRLGGQEMRDLVPSNIGVSTTGYLPLPLPQGMRDIQQSVVSFAGDSPIGFDYGRYNANTLAGRLSVTGTSKRLVTVGSTDGTQGLVYVTQDLNRTTGEVGTAVLSIAGLSSSQVWNVEFWSTGANSVMLDVQWGLSVVSGKLSMVLPSFAQDVMVRFRTDQL